MKNDRVYYFTDEDYQIKKRQRNIETIPEENKYLRNNVEATVKEFKKDYRHGKLKVRGRFKTELFAFAMGMAINFGRIYRFAIENPEVYVGFLNYVFYFFVIMAQNFRKKNFMALKSVFFTEIVKYHLKEAF